VRTLVESFKELSDLLIELGDLDVFSVSVDVHPTGSHLFPCSLPGGPITRSDLDVHDAAHLDHAPCPCWDVPPSSAWATPSGDPGANAHRLAALLAASRLTLEVLPTLKAQAARLDAGTLAAADLPGVLGVLASTPDLAPSVASSSSSFAVVNSQLRRDQLKGLGPILPVTWASVASSVTSLCAWARDELILRAGTEALVPGRGDVGAGPSASRDAVLVRWELRSTNDGPLTDTWVGVLAATRVAPSTFLLNRALLDTLAGRLGTSPRERVLLDPSDAELLEVVTTLVKDDPGLSLGAALEVAAALR
jgi:hypothetical protein